MNNSAAIAGQQRIWWADRPTSVTRWCQSLTETHHIPPSTTEWKITSHESFRFNGNICHKRQHPVEKVMLMWWWNWRAGRGSRSSSCSTTGRQLRGLKCSNIKLKKKTWCCETWMWNILHGNCLHFTTSTSPQQQISREESWKLKNKMRSEPKLKGCQDHSGRRSFQVGIHL